MSTLHVDHTEGGLRLRLVGSLTIAEAATVRTELMQALSAAPVAPQDAVLDVGTVGEIDSAGVQLLVSTAGWLQGLQARPLLGSASTGVEQVAQALGAADAQHCCGFARAATTGAGT